VKELSRPILQRPALDFFHLKLCLLEPHRLVGTEQITSQITSTQSTNISTLNQISNHKTVGVDSVTADPVTGLTIELYSVRIY